MADMTDLNAAFTANAVAAAVFTAAPGTNTMAMSGSMRTPASADGDATLRPIVAEGRATFWTMPGDIYRYTIASDKLESKIALESRKSKQKWECTLDDAKMKQYGPERVELPRHVVIAYLVDTLQAPQVGPHRVMLQTDGDQLSLTLTLVFGPMFAPTYTIPLVRCILSREDLLQAQVVELQDEVSELRSELAELREFVRKHVHVESKTTTETRSSCSLHTTQPANSTLNARAAEFVFGQPPPTTTHRMVTTSDDGGLQSSLPRPPSTTPTRSVFSTYAIYPPPAPDSS